jgi:peptidoglycan/LPS O-acetylase OafA/YrhL
LAGSAPGADALAYRPHLDGLRAVAVYLVLLFDAGSDRFSGGYVGVDVFFVLSGFLLTHVLLRGLAGRGSVRFRQFYSRRVRRLLPAAFVALVVTAFVYTAVASPVEVGDAVGGFKAAFLGVANWYFIHHSTDYVAADVATNPVLNFWSIAVAEQFALLWPLLLGGLFLVARRFGRRRWAVIRAAVALAAVASLLWALLLRTDQPDRAYYGTDARAYQLLAGALIALTPAAVARLSRFPRAARRAGIVAIAGLFLLASAWVHFDAIERGAAVTVVTVVLLAALEAGAGGLLQRALSAGPMVYLGKISYGTYLWHWIVILLLVRFFHPSPISSVAMAALVATALASLSFHLMERPVRESGVLDRHRLQVIVTGLVASVIGAAIVVPAIVDPSSASSVAPAVGTGTVGAGAVASGFAAVPSSLDFEAIKRAFPKPVGCYGEAPSACTVVHGRGARVLLMGDSHAEMLIPTFEAIARSRDLTLSVSVHLGCPWQRDLYAQPLIATAAQRLAACERMKGDAYDRVIPALDPDVVVLMNQGYEQPGYPGGYLGPDGQLLTPGSAAETAWVTKATTDSVHALEQGGRKVVLLEPIPRAPAPLDTLDCLSSAKVVAECRYVASTEPTDVERRYRALDKADDDMWSMDLDRLVCPYLPICDPIVDHEVVTTDGAHLTRDFAAALAAPVADALENNAILAG